MIEMRDRMAAPFSGDNSMPATVADPEVGVSSVPSVRTVVVLPAPFGPRNPNTSPVADLEGDVVERDAATEALAQVLDHHCWLGGPTLRLSRVGAARSASDRHIDLRRAPRTSTHRGWTWIEDDPIITTPLCSMCCRTKLSPIVGCLPGAGAAQLVPRPACCLDEEGV